MEQGRAGLPVAGRREQDGGGGGASEMGMEF